MNAHIPNIFYLLYTKGDLLKPPVKILRLISPGQNPLSPNRPCQNSLQSNSHGKNPPLKIPKRQNQFLIWSLILMLSKYFSTLIPIKIMKFFEVKFQPILGNFLTILDPYCIDPL